MRSICISMLEFLQTIRFVQNLLAFLYKLTRQLSRRKETAKSAENFLGIWTQISVSAMMSVHRSTVSAAWSRSAAIMRKILQITSLHTKRGGGLFYMKTSDFYCAECCKNLR